MCCVSRLAHRVGSTLLLQSWHTFECCCYACLAKYDAMYAGRYVHKSATYVGNLSLISTMCAININIETCQNYLSFRFHLNLWMYSVWKATKSVFVTNLYKQTCVWRSGIWKVMVLVRVMKGRLVQLANELDVTWQLSFVGCVPLSSLVILLCAIYILFQAIAL